MQAGTTEAGTSGTKAREPMQSTCKARGTKSTLTSMTLTTRAIGATTPIRVNVQGMTMDMGTTAIAFHTKAEYQMIQDSDNPIH